MSNKPFKNKLNNLDPQSWIKFQKSWFLHNPPPRQKDVLRHPAKFPETLAKEFIEFFSKNGQVILDPLAGTGSALVAALIAGRHSYGIELNPGYVDIARQAIEQKRHELGLSCQSIVSEMILGDSNYISDLLNAHQLSEIDYVITSPPYWNMLHAKGAEIQSLRRSTPGLDVFYSDDDRDLGNISDYAIFIERLTWIFSALKPFLRKKAYLTVIVKNIKKGGKVYPLAWDLAQRLGQIFTLKDERIWVQDNIRLAPYGFGNAWVSNTFHHYCLQFRNE